MQANNNVVCPLIRGEQFTLGTLLDVFMATYQGRDAQYGTRVTFFSSQFKDKPVCLIVADDVDDALDVLTRRGKLLNRGGTKRGGELVTTSKPLAPATINRYRTNLQSILTWARKKRLLPKGWQNPVCETERLPEDNARTRYLSLIEYEKLLKVSRLARWDHLTVLIMLAVTTGARKGTLLGLKWSDVDLEACTAKVDRMKNGDAFTLVLLPEVCNELRRIKRKALSEDLVFRGRRPDTPMNYEKAWHLALQNAGIEGAVFHSLRHTHASWLAQQGAPLLAIAESMGHKSLAMTKRYAHLCIDSRKKMLHEVFCLGGSTHLATQANSREHNS